MDIDIFGRNYEFPAIKDGRFEALQGEIAQTRDTIERGSREQSKLFGLKKGPPSLSPERRLELMDQLVLHYNELLACLKAKIGGCRSAFEAIGEGVRDSFEAKVRELEAMEGRRAVIVSELAAQGKAEVASMLEPERERIRGLAQNLAGASLLIIRKLRHALEALEVLASDETSQRGVLDKLKSDVIVYRKLFKFSNDMDRIQNEIDNLTKTALNFDRLLRDELGPLGVLIDEIAKVDARVAESLAEVQRLSMQLEGGQAVGKLDLGSSSRLLDLLVGVKVKADTVSAIVERLASDAEAPFDDFDIELTADASLDFGALAENMSVLVESGLRGLRLRSLPPPISGPSAVAGPPAIPARPVIETALVTAPAQSPANAEPAQAKPETEPSTAQTPESPPPSVAPAWATVAASALRGEGQPSQTAAARRQRDSDYRAAISRADPTLIVFLLDRSGSMDAAYAGGMNKSEYLAQTVDRALYELAVRCMRPDGVRDYFHLTCLGYGDGKVTSAFPVALSGSDWVPVSRVAASPARLAESAAGGTEPRWIEPVARGDTPMRAAFEEACRLVASWCDAHPRSYPPTVINVSDGEPTDGDPLQAAEVLGRLHTDDGECLVFNLHVSSAGGNEVVFPSSTSGLDEHGRRLFAMSSRFPPHLLKQASDSRFPVGSDSRFFAYGAGAELATRFLELGTRPTGLR